MNTEEKARRYDEALNWMREIYPGLHGATKEDAEHFFPELAYSEDERIREAIIELLKEVGRDDTGISENAKCMIAYLEKQRVEENYDRMQPIYDDRDSFESALEKAWKSYNESASRRVDSFEDNYIECVHAKGFREGYLYGIQQTPVLTDDDKKYIPCELDFLCNDVLAGRPIAINRKEAVKIRAWLVDVKECLEKQKEQKPLTTEETELNSIAFLEQMGYTCIPPGKEQRLTESRKRNKPKESWLSKAKYEIEHADELLRQSQEELKEIRELKKQEQKPICDIASDDAIESCMLRYLQSAANRKDDIEIIEDTKAYKSELISIIKKEQKPVEWSDEDTEMYINVASSLRGYACGLENEEHKRHIQNELDWLENRFESLRPQSKQEWSEEDEETIGTLINYFEGDALDCSTDEMIRRIKVLRPQQKKCK